MSLTQDLANLREESRRKIPDDNLAVIGRAIEDLARSGLVEAALSKGDTAPDFLLPDAADRSVSLSKLLEQGPVVLSFYRGGW